MYVVTKSGTNTNLRVRQISWRNGAIYQEKIYLLIMQYIDMNISGKNLKIDYQKEFSVNLVHLNKVMLFSRSS
jgi:hypothetical protein